MPRLAYNGPPKGYTYSGKKKWTDKMNARLGNAVRLMVTYRFKADQLDEAIKFEIEKIRKDFGYTNPKTHEQ